MTIRAYGQDFVIVDLDDTPEEQRIRDVRYARFHAILNKKLAPLGISLADFLSCSLEPPFLFGSYAKRLQRLTQKKPEDLDLIVSMSFEKTLTDLVEQITQLTSSQELVQQMMAQSDFFEKAGSNSALSFYFYLMEKSLDVASVKKPLTEEDFKKLYNDVQAFFCKQSWRGSVRLDKSTTPKWPEDWFEQFFLKIPVDPVDDDPSRQELHIDLNCRLKINNGVGLTSVQAAGYLFVKGQWIPVILPLPGNPRLTASWYKTSLRERKIAVNSLQYLNSQLTPSSPMLPKHLFSWIANLVKNFSPENPLEYFTSFLLQLDRHIQSKKNSLKNDWQKDFLSLAKIHLSSSGIYHLFVSLIWLKTRDFSLYKDIPIELQARLSQLVAFSTEKVFLQQLFQGQELFTREKFEWIHNLLLFKALETSSEQFVTFLQMGKSHAELYRAWLTIPLIEEAPPFLFSDKERRELIEKEKPTARSCRLVFNAMRSNLDFQWFGLLEKNLLRPGAEAAERISIFISLVLLFPSQLTNEKVKQWKELQSLAAKIVDGKAVKLLFQIEKSEGDTLYCNPRKNLVAFCLYLYQSSPELGFIALHALDTLGMERPKEVGFDSLVDSQHPEALRLAEKYWKADKRKIWTFEQINRCATVWSSESLSTIFDEPGSITSKSLAISEEKVWECIQTIHGWQEQSLNLKTKASMFVIKEWIRINIPADDAKKRLSNTVPEEYLSLFVEILEVSQTRKSREILLDLSLKFPHRFSAEKHLEMWLSFIKLRSTEDQALLLGLKRRIPTENPLFRTILLEFQLMEYLQSRRKIDTENIDIIEKLLPSQNHHIEFCIQFYTALVQDQKDIPPQVLIFLKRAGLEKKSSTNIFEKEFHWIRVHLFRKVDKQLTAATGKEEVSSLGSAVLLDLFRNFNEHKLRPYADLLIHYFSAGIKIHFHSFSFKEWVLLAYQLAVAKDTTPREEDVITQLMEEMVDEVACEKINQFTNLLALVFEADKEHGARHLPEYDFFFSFFVERAFPQSPRTAIRFFNIYLDHEVDPTNGTHIKSGFFEFGAKQIVRHPELLDKWVRFFNHIDKFDLVLQRMSEEKVKETFALILDYALKTGQKEWKELAVRLYKTTAFAKQGTSTKDERVTESFDQLLHLIHFKIELGEKVHSDSDFDVLLHDLLEKIHSTSEITEDQLQRTHQVIIGFVKKVDSCLRADSKSYWETVYLVRRNLQYLMDILLQLSSAYPSFDFQTEASLILPLLVSNAVHPGCIIDKDLTLKMFSFDRQAFLAFLFPGICQLTVIFSFLENSTHKLAPTERKEIIEKVIKQCSRIVFKQSLLRRVVPRECLEESAAYLYVILQSLKIELLDDYHPTVKDDVARYCLDFEKDDFVKGEFNDERFLEALEAIICVVTRLSMDPERLEKWKILLQESSRLLIRCSNEKERMKNSLSSQMKRKPREECVLLLSHRLIFELTNENCIDAKEIILNELFNFWLDEECQVDFFEKKILNMTINLLIKEPGDGSFLTKKKSEWRSLLKEGQLARPGSFSREKAERIRHLLNQLKIHTEHKSVAFLPNSAKSAADIQHPVGNKGRTIQSIIAQFLRYFD